MIIMKRRREKERAPEHYECHHEFFLMRLKSLVDILRDGKRSRDRGGGSGVNQLCPLISFVSRAFVTSFSNGASA